MKVTIHVAVEAYEGFSRKYGADVRDPKTGAVIISKSIDDIKARFPQGTEFVLTDRVADKLVFAGK